MTLETLEYLRIGHQTGSTTKVKINSGANAVIITVNYIIKFARWNCH